MALKGQFGDNPYEANAYRIFKFPWKATTHWDPVLVVNYKPDYVADLYMNWDGATEYDNRVIFLVPFVPLTLLESKRLLVSKRTGFEIHVPLETLETNFIIAVARCGKENVGQVFSCAVSVLIALH